MHLRRALLLFAIVLGLAAVAAALSTPPQQRRAEPRRADRPPPRRQPRAAAQVTRILFRQRGRPAVRRLDVGQAAVVTVEVERPGQVELPALGMAASAEPLTPATLEVLPPSAGRYQLRFTAAGELASERLGVLAVTPETERDPASAGTRPRARSGAPGASGAR